MAVVMTPEGRVKAAIKKYLQAHGFWAAGGKKPEVVRGWYHMPVAAALGVHGIPDFVCVYQGHALYIEAKAPGGKPTENQLKRHEELRSAGATVLLIDDVSQLAAHFGEEHDQPSIES